MQNFVDHIGVSYGIRSEDMAVVAQSVGAVLIAAWAHDYAPKIRCMVLASPAFQVKLYVPFARTALKLKQSWRGLFYVNSYVKARLLTHDEARVTSYDSDPLITRAIAVDVLLGLYQAANRVVADARALTIPTALLISGSDYVVKHGVQHRFYERRSLKGVPTLRCAPASTPRCSIGSPATRSGRARSRPARRGTAEARLAVQSGARDRATGIGRPQAPDFAGRGAGVQVAVVVFGTALVTL